jgi:HD-GYP domain-containing protein (c-di-GMP phosphodiesterase class II)
MSEVGPDHARSVEQQLQYARDLRRIYDVERQRRRELEATHRALAEANAELDRRVTDLLAAQDCILAVNSSHALPVLVESLLQPLIRLLQARTAVVFPWDPQASALMRALGPGLASETALLAALRTSALSASVLTARQPFEVADMGEPPAPGSPDPNSVPSAGARTDGGAGNGLAGSGACAVPAAGEAERRVADVGALLPVDARETGWGEAGRRARGGLGLDYSVPRALGWRALAARPLVAQGEVVGLLYVAWDTPHVTDEREQRLLELLAQHAAVSLFNARVLAERARRATALQQAEQQLVAYARDLHQAFERERARRGEVHAAYLTTVQLMAAAIETRDPYTGGHVERVATFSVATGSELDWQTDQLEMLELGALLHDVGKIGVEDRVLRKPGTLDDEEWAQMRLHPEIGARILEAVAFLRSVSDCALRHHERYDGRGYPGGLAGDLIPVEARVIAVADTFDAMTSDRPYRRGLPTHVAIEEIERHTGTQFDSAVVAAFLRAVQAGAVLGQGDDG